MTFNQTLYRAVYLWWEQYELFLLRLAVIFSVVAASFVLGPRASMTYFILLAGIGAFLLFMRWPPLGVILTMLGGISVPFYGPSGLNVAMLGTALLIGLWVANMVVVKRQIQLVSLETARPGLALIVVGVLALLIGQLSWYPTDQAPLGAQAGGLAIFVLSVGIFLVVGNQVKSLGWLKAITWSFLGFSSLDLVGWTVPQLGRYLDPLFAYGSTGSLFWTWIVTLAFGQALFNRDLHIGWRLLFGFQVVLAVYVTMGEMYDWKSGWVPPLAGMAAMIALSSWRMFIAMILVSPVPAVQLLARAVETDEYSYSTRLDAWEIVLEIAKVNPFLGLGPANYYWYTPLFPIRGYYVHFNSHSQIIDIIAQIGVLGLLTCAWFLLKIGQLNLRLLFANYTNGFARGYVYGALGGLVGMLVAAALGDWIFPFFYNVGMNGFRASMLGWLFLGGLVALEQIMGNQKRANSAGPNDVSVVVTLAEQRANSGRRE